MKKISEYLLLCLFIALMSCTEENPLINQDQFVISAFIYEGQPVDDIEVTSTLSLGASDSIAPPIEDASVSLLRNGISYALDPDPSRPGYYYSPGTGLQIYSGDHFKIEVTYNNVTAYGETDVPLKPMNVSLSDSILTVPQQTFPFQGGDPSDNSILLSWINDDAELFYVVLENTESDPEPIIGDSRFGKFRRFISSPAKVSEFLISPRSVTYLGNYQGIVYRVNQEYADLYESRQQDSRQLQEPISNIQNALGVFSAFASDTVYFRVERE